MDLLKVSACGLVKTVAQVKMNTVIQVLLRICTERAVLPKGERAEASLLTRRERTAYGPTGDVTLPPAYGTCRYANHRVVVWKCVVQLVAG